MRERRDRHAWRSPLSLVCSRACSPAATDLVGRRCAYRRMLLMVVDAIVGVLWIAKGGLLERSWLWLATLALAADRRFLLLLPCRGERQLDGLGDEQVDGLEELDDIVAVNGDGLEGEGGVGAPVDRCRRGEILGMASSS